MLPAYHNLPDGSGFGGNAYGRGIAGLCTWPLEAIVAEICVRAGMDPRTFDVSQLYGIECRGFAITNIYAAYGALQSLSQIFLFDPSNYDGKVHFVTRGNDVALTITQDMFVLDDAQTNDGVEDQSKSSDPIQIPRVLNLNYYDIAGGLATDMQTSERSGDRRAVGSQSLQTAVVMDADEAKWVVGINHKIMIEDQKAEVKFSLSDTQLSLAVADCIFLEYEGSVDRYRIAQADINDGKQDYILLHDRQSAYISSAQGFPAAPQTPPPNRLVGTTLLEVMDIHILADRDDFLGAYVAVAGRVNAWYGATVELSIDGGANYIDSFVAQTQAIIGETATAISDHPFAYPDTINTLRVVIELPDTDLLDATFPQLLNKTNMAIVGDEVFQFGDVDEPTPGTFDLSYLLRGRNQSQTVAHAVGERFVLLDRTALYYIPAELMYRNRTLTLRATSLGASATDDPTIVTFTFVGESQIERAPGYLSARRTATDVVIAWQGIGKLGAGVNVAMGVSFVNYHVVITDGTLTHTFDTTNQFYTDALSGFSGPLTITVSARNSLTGLGPATTVII